MSVSIKVKDKIRKKLMLKRINENKKSVSDVIEELLKKDVKRK